MKVKMYTVTSTDDDLVVQHVRLSPSGIPIIDKHKAKSRKVSTKGGITSVSGRFTVVFDGTEVIVTAGGIAVCSKQDTFYRAVGFNEAFKRAAERAVSQLTRKPAFFAGWGLATGEGGKLYSLDVYVEQKE